MERLPGTTVRLPDPKDPRAVWETELREHRELLRRTTYNHREASAHGGYDGTETGEDELVLQEEITYPPLIALSARNPPNAVQGPSGWIYHSKTFGFLRPSDSPRRLAIWIVESPLFDPVILITILVNCCTMAWASPLDEPGTEKQAFLAMAEPIFLYIFTFELVTKMIAYGVVGHEHSYLRDPWCQLDFVVVSSVWLPILLPSLFGNMNGQALRALRPLRALKRVPGMPVLVGSIFKSLPALANVGGIAAFFFIIYAIVGVELFKGVLHYRCADPMVLTLASQSERISRSRHLLQGTGAQPSAPGFTLAWTGQPLATAAPPLAAARTARRAAAWAAGRRALRGGSSGGGSSGSILERSDRGSGDGYFEEEGEGEPLSIDEQIAGYDSGTFCTSLGDTDTCAESGETCYYFEQNPGGGTISFDNALMAMLPIMQAVTADTWTDPMFAAMDAFSYTAWFYFVSAIVIGGMFVVNLFLAVIFDEFMRAQATEDAEREVTKKVRESAGDVLDVDELAIAELIKSRRGRRQDANSCMICDCTPEHGGCCGWRASLSDTMNSPTMGNVSTGFVIFNLAVMCMPYAGQPDWWGELVELLGEFVTWVFIVEMFLKLLGMGCRAYWIDNWNALDGVIVSLSIAEMAITVLLADTGVNISFLRMLRLLRLLRLLKAWPGLYKIVMAFAKAIPQISNLFVLMLLVMSIFALLGMQAFGGIPEISADSRWHFDYFYNAMLTVFGVFSGGWVDAFQVVAAQMGVVAAAAFFLPCLIIGFFIILNLFVAILLEAFAGDDEDEEEEEGGEKAAEGNVAEAVEVPEVEAKAIKPSPPLHVLKQVLPEEEIEKLIPVLSPERGSPVGSLGASSFPRRRNRDSAEDLELATEKELLVPSLPALEGVSLGLFGPESKLRKFCQWLSCHPHFDTLTILLIVVSSTCLAIDLPRLDPDSATKASLDQLNLWLTGFFVLEMLLKIVAKGFLFVPDAYLRSGWNVLDFVIVLISILGLLADLVPAFGQLKSLRILRVLRPLRLLQRNAGMKTIIMSLIETLPSIVEVSAVVLVFHIVFSILGMMLFSGAWGACTDPSITVRTECTPEGAARRALAQLGAAGPYPTSANVSWPAISEDYTASRVAIVVLDKSSAPTAPTVAGSASAPPLPPPRLPHDLVPSPLPLRTAAEGGDLVDPLDPIEAKRRAIACGKALNVLRRELAVSHWRGRVTANKHGPDQEKRRRERQRQRLLKGGGGGGSNEDEEQESDLPVHWLNPAFGSFDDFGSAMLVLYVALTGDGWDAFMFQGMDVVGVDVAPERNDASANSIFFLLWIVIGTFVSANLFVGAIVDNFTRLQSEADGSALMSDEQQQWVQAMKASNSNPNKGRREPTFGPQRVFFLLVTSREFEYFVFGVIVLNIAWMALDYDRIVENEPYNWMYETGLVAFTYFYFFEFALKICGLGCGGYFGDGWCRFDFFLVCVAAGDMYLNELMQLLPLPPTLLRVLRIARVLRILQLLKSLKGVRDLVMTLVFAFPALCNVGLLLGIVMFMYAVLGINVFTYVQRGETINEHRNFETLGNAFITLFQCLTGDGWSSIMDDAMINEERGCDPKPLDGSPSDCGSPLALPYFVSFVIVGNFIFLNLVVAVIIDNFTALGKQNPDLVSASDILDFKDAWGLYDPDADGKIPVKDLPDLLMGLRPPLGLLGSSLLSGTNPRAKVLRFCLTLQLHQRDGMIEFKTTLDALIKKNYDSKNIEYLPPEISETRAQGPPKMTPRRRGMASVYAEELIADGVINFKRRKGIPVSAKPPSPDRRSASPSIFEILGEGKLTSVHSISPLGPGYREEIMHKYRNANSFSPETVARMAERREMIKEKAAEAFEEAGANARSKLEVDVQAEAETVAAAAIEATPASKRPRPAPNLVPRVANTPTRARSLPPSSSNKHSYSPPRPVAPSPDMLKPQLNAAMLPRHLAKKILLPVGEGGSGAATDRAPGTVDETPMPRGASTDRMRFKAITPSHGGPSTPSPGTGSNPRSGANRSPPMAGGAAAVAYDGVRPRSTTPPSAMPSGVSPPSAMPSAGSRRPGCELPRPSSLPAPSRTPQPLGNFKPVAEGKL